jgi:hypothetical protein
MHPESSDGFASVGTILPKEKAALLPGGFFARWMSPGRAQEGRSRPIVLLDRPYSQTATPPIVRRELIASDRWLFWRLPMLKVIVALVCAAMAMAPSVRALTATLDDAGHR